MGGRGVPLPGELPLWFGLALWFELALRLGLPLEFRAGLRLGWRVVALLRVGGFGGLGLACGLSLPRAVVHPAILGQAARRAGADGLPLREGRCHEGAKRHGAESTSE
jgi:hypothetical protein